MKVLNFKEHIDRQIEKYTSNLVSIESYSFYQHAVSFRVIYEYSGCRNPMYIHVIFKI